MAKKKKKMPGLNTSSTADISFMLLIFFLVTTSMDTDMGLARRLPQPPDPDQEDAQIDVKERNVLNVRINAAGNLMCNHEYIDVSELRARAKEFIKNEANSPTFCLSIPVMVILPVFASVVTVSPCGMIAINSDE